MLKIFVDRYSRGKAYCTTAQIIIVARIKYEKALIFFLGFFLVPLEADEPYFLSLQEVVEQTLKTQWAVLNSELNIDVQKGLLEQATGAFNPELAAAMSRLFQRDLQTFVGMKTDFNGRVTTTNASIQTLARLGTTYGISYDNVNTFNPLTFTGLIPPRTDATTLSANITQPLLRNLLYSPQTTLEKAQKLQVKAAQLQNVQNIAQAVLNSINSYWDLVAARKLLCIQREQEQLLQDLENYAEELVKEQQAGYASIYQPRADLAFVTSQRIQAEQNVRSAYNILLFNMGLIPDDKAEIPDLELENYPDFQQFCKLGTDWYDKYAATVPENRADVIAANLLIEIADLNLKSAKNALLPELNVSGIASLLNTTAAKKADRFQSSDLDGPEKDYTLGVSFTFPIFNDFAKGLVKQDRALKSQAVVNESLLEGQIYSALKTDYTLYNALQLEVEKVRVATVEYEKTVETELIKLHEGLSSYFIVLTQQTSWQGSLQQLIVLENLYAQNITTLLFDLGKLVKWESLNDPIVADDVIYSLDLFKEEPCEKIQYEYQESEGLYGS